MNRATATTAANLNLTERMRKRKSRTSSENSLKEEEEETTTTTAAAAAAAATTNTSSDNLSNRKSTRIKNTTKTSGSNNIVLVVPKINKANNAINSSDTVMFNDKSQLNGAQFLNAASINTTKLTSTSSSNAKYSDLISGGSGGGGGGAEEGLVDTQIDLNKLSEKVDDLSKKLEEHTSLFKKLTNVVDKLSAKLDDSINNSLLNRNKNDLKRKNRGKRNNETDDNEEKEKEIENEEDEESDIEEITEVKKKKKQNVSESMNVQDGQNDDIELINQNKTKSSEKEKEKSINLNLPLLLPISPSISNSPSKLIKLKLDDLPPSLNEEIETVVSASLIEMKNSFLTNDQIAELNSQAKNIKTTFTSISNSTNNNNNNNENITSTINNTNNDSRHFISESSHSDADDEDDFEEDDGSKKSSRSSSNSNKNGSIAILNKTKIDTEFISNLIANKDPNDKRYDANEINKLRLLSHSYQNFAVKLLCRLFDEEEIIGRNVYGRNYSGDKTIMKQPLDPERINFIKETVLRLTKTNNPDLAWASCVIAMNRKMVDINNKYLKGIKE